MTALLEGVFRADGDWPARHAVASPAVAWGRELEVARRLAWFHGAAGSAAGDPQSMPDPGRDAERPPGEAPLAAGVPLASCAAWASPGAGVIGDSGWQAVPGRTALAGVAPSAGVAVATQPSRTLILACTPMEPGHLHGATPPAGVAAESRNGAAPLAMAATGTGAATPAAQSRSAKPSLRLHVEDTPQGVVVWLGMDGDAAGSAARAAPLVAELRRLLAASGQRLAGVICNGTPMQDAAPPAFPPHQEP